MSDVIICGECGQLKPRQRVVCPKHDFVHDPDKHCDHCENEIAQKLIESAANNTETESGT